MMNDMCICNVFMDFEDSSLFQTKRNTRYINKINFQYINAPWTKQYKTLRQKSSAHPLWCNVGIQSPLLLKQPSEFQNLLLACVELGFESISLSFELYPIPLQVFKRCGHVGMQDSVWNISFFNRLNDYWEKGGIMHHKTLSAISYPFEVRLKGVEFLCPKVLLSTLFTKPQALTNL